MSAKNVNSEAFEQELEVSCPVVVDFWAPWCGPCKVLGPILNDLADKYEGTVKVLKVDVMENRELAKQYGITSIPFIAVFKNGKLVHTKTGFSGRETVEKLFEELAE